MKAAEKKTRQEIQVARSPKEAWPTHADYQTLGMVRAFSVRFLSGHMVAKPSKSGALSGSSRLLRTPRLTPMPPSGSQALPPGCASPL